MPFTGSYAKQLAVRKDTLRWSGPVNVGDSTCESGNQVAARMAGVYHRSMDGRGLALQVKELPSAQRWIGSGTRLLSGRDFINALLVRGNLLPTPARKSRGREGVSPLCPTCGTWCTLGHISQVCPRTHGMRVARHDNIVKYVTEQLRGRNFTVLVEPTIPCGGSYLKPDLVCWQRGRAFVLDVVVTSDGFGFSEAINRKVSKYDNEVVRRFVSSVSGINEISVEGIALSWRGCWSKQSAHVLTRLGLNHGHLAIMAIRVLTWTSNIWRCFNRTGMRPALPGGPGALVA